MSALSRSEVLVAGGGCVGGTLACALAQAGVATTLIEAQPPRGPWAADSVDLRVYAISRASQAIFEHLGIWDEILDAGACPYERMQVWDAGGGGEIRFDAADIGEPVLGHIIEERVIVRALEGLAQRSEALTVERPARVTDLAREPDAVRVRLDDGRWREATLLVGADGRASRVRQLAGIGVDAHDYRQQAIVCVVETERPHQATAWQRFLPTGPLAFLPLRRGRCSIVWSTTPEDAEVLLALDEASFAERLGAAFEHRLGAITAVGERVAFPLARQHAEHYVAERIALVGDAAHVIHPLAGQGVNLGLLDAAALAEIVADTRRRRRDPGRLHGLRRYERWRRGDNLAMMWAMDGFKRLFGSRNPLLAGARNLGLGLVDRAGPLKTPLMRQAMGLAGDLPRMADARYHRGKMQEAGYK